jgi:cytochrome c553
MRASDLGLMSCCAALLLVTGCRVSKPGRGESSVLTWFKHRVTVGGKNDSNPLGQGQAVIDEGRKAFGSYCTVCHGLDGQNTGVPFATQMSPPVPSLASTETQKYTDGQLRWIIENGVSPSGMPASRGILSDEEMWSIVVYLRHLPPAGSLGEPGVYAGACNPQPDQSDSEKPSVPPHAGKEVRGNARSTHR